MPETTAATRPTRTRAARASKAASKATPAKAAPVKAATAATPAPVESAEVKDGDVKRFFVTMEHAGDTKNYSKWTAPEGSGLVGSLYAPLGATGVRVAVSGETE